MFKSLTVLLLFFLLTACGNNRSVNLYPEFYKEVSVLNDVDNTFTINEVIKKHQTTSDFRKMPNTAFFNFKESKTRWFHFKPQINTEDTFLSVWNSHLDDSELYTVKNGKVIDTERFSLYNNVYTSEPYRLPTWRLKVAQNPTDYYLKVQETGSSSSVKLLYNTYSSFLQFSQTDFMIIAGQVMLYIVLIILVVGLAIARKEYSLIYFGIFVLLYGVEFLIHKGVDVHYFAPDNAIWHYSKKTFFQNLANIFGLVFYIKFYPYTPQTQFIKKMFIVLLCMFIIFALLFGVMFITNNTLFPKYFIWMPMRISALFVIFGNIYLAYKRVLPFYIGVIFSLPIIFFFAYMLISIPQDAPMLINFMVDNFFYLAVTLEIIGVTYYIINSFVKSEALANNLKKENLKLKNTFQNSVLEMQQSERNKLLSNVHDSFGGYLEALKLRLLNYNEQSPEKINEILEAFNTEYRYLLHSLHSPKVNSGNFIENLSEFCDTMNRLSKHSISKQFSLNSTPIPQETCVHLFMIISELITNAIKYSKANKIEVHLNQSPNNAIELTVKDDGIGFNVNKKKKNAFGLGNIYERVNLLEGKISIDSQIGNGTQIQIVV